MEKEKLEHLKSLLEALAEELAQGLAADAGKPAPAPQGDLSGRQLAVHSALRRIADGTYGVCAACNQPIAEKSLEAAPETPLCANCSW